METVTVRFDDSLIALRRVFVTADVSDRVVAADAREELQPRLCFNDSCLTASGGDFGFLDLKDSDASR